MNANVAGIFWGIFMWLALWMKQKTLGLSRVAYTTCAVLFCFNVLATASRAALLALVSTAFISIIIQTLCSHNKLMSFRQASSNIIIIAITVMSAFALQSIDSADGGIMHRIFQDIGEHEVSGHPKRSLLWAHAVTVIRQSPIVGHGVVDFAVFDFPMGFPPHNSILQVWIYGGLIAVIGLLCLFFTVGWQMIRKLQHDYNMWLPIIILAWVIIQAMFTNLPIGDFRKTISLWLIVLLFLCSPQYSDTAQEAN